VVSVNVCSALLGSGFQRQMFPFLSVPELSASSRSYTVQAHKQICVCSHGEEVHARKWKLYAPTQDTAGSDPDNILTALSFTFIYFIYALFDGTFRNSDCIASNIMIMN
jgi:hypothetical protein